MKKDSKIGIITFHASHNCGSMMQAYALQNVLFKNGYNNEIIDFQTEGQKDKYAVWHSKPNIKNVVKNFISLTHPIKMQKVWNEYESFMSKNMILSQEKYTKKEELNNISKKYNLCICGADQIWNITIKDASDAYFLPYMNIKKVAYAPSFGAKKIQDHTNEVDKYKKYLVDFDALSIREKNGQKWIDELINTKVPIVLDPTLLLDANDYDKIREASHIKGKYIFYYAPTYSKKLDKFVKKIGKKYNLPIIVWNAREYFFRFEWVNGFKLTKVEHPGIYLDLIKNAELVITTSFHGTIFSTIYRKKFWTLKNGEMYQDDDRVKTLINQLKIEDRLISPKFDENIDYMKEVDYSQYERQLPKLKEESINYLFDSIRGVTK